MLTWNQTLTYVKQNMSLPSTFFEKNDTELREYLTNTALREFSTIFPDISRTSVITDNTNYQVPGKRSQYYFFDEEGLEIYSIVECYFPLGDSAIMGHPTFGPTSLEAMKWWSLDVFKARTIESYSDFNKSYKFIEPNIVEILENSTYRSNMIFTIEYIRSQPKDLSKVNPRSSMDFMDLCLAHTKLWIGSLRSHFGEGRVTTPLGDLPINGENLKSEGTELRREVMERLRDQYVPEIYFDVD